MVTLRLGADMVIVNLSAEKSGLPWQCSKDQVNMVLALDKFQGTTHSMMHWKNTDNACVSMVLVSLA